MRRHSFAVALTLLTTPLAAAEVTGHFAWNTPWAHGVSGWEILDESGSFVAVTDRGWFLAGQLNRADGVLSGVTLTDIAPIRGHDGRPSAARVIGDWTDAEGLAITNDGDLVVGFERWMHLGRYRSTGSAKQILPELPDFFAYPDNRQIEAVAVHPDGRIFAWPERPLRGGRFDVFVFEETAYKITDAVPETDGFSIVGADFADDGTLYLLERKQFLARWWENRIRVIHNLDWEAGKVIWASTPNQFYNLEGLSLIPGSPDRLMLIGDNNNNENRSTDIVEITLTD